MKNFVDVKFRILRKNVESKPAVKIMLKMKMLDCADIKSHIFVKSYYFCLQNAELRENLALHILQNAELC